MKNIIRKWLGINNIVDSLMETRLRLTDLEAEVKKNEDGGQIFEGSTVKVDSLKEFVYGMAKYLKLQPRRTFKEVPVEPTTTKVERVYEVIKVK